MSRHMVPVMLGLTVFPLGAIGIAAYLAVSPEAEIPMVSGGILLLACSILAVSTAVIVRLARHEDWLWSDNEAIRRLAERTEEALDRITVLEHRAEETSPEAAPRIDEIATEMGAMRREMKEFMAAQRSRPAAPERTERAERQEPQLGMPNLGTPNFGPAEKSAEKPAPASHPEQLTLMLEPMVELSTGTTTHYRALMGLTDSQGNMVPHNELMQKAEQGGMRPALDIRMVKMVAPVLRRLRQRNPGLRAFIPLSRATLNTQEDAARLVAVLEREGDVAAGMVFEFAQQDLGRLDGTGIENLARLARSGVTLGLREVYLGGLDLLALRQLGVRFLSFPPHAVDAGSGPTPAWTEFVANARSLQMQIIVGDVKTPQQAAAVTRFARYGHGEFFAPPRRVRADAGVAPSAPVRTANVA